MYSEQIYISSLNTIKMLTRWKCNKEYTFASRKFNTAVMINN